MKIKFVRTVLASCAIAGAQPEVTPGTTGAALTLEAQCPGVISDHAVFQQGISIPEIRKIEAGIFAGQLEGIGGTVCDNEPLIVQIRHAGKVR